MAKIIPMHGDGVNIEAKTLREMIAKSLTVVECMGCHPTHLILGGEYYIQFMLEFKTGELISENREVCRFMGLDIIRVPEQMMQFGYSVE